MQPRRLEDAKNFKPRFEPREAAAAEAAVWAIDDARLRNYLVAREYPRVTEVRIVRSLWPLHDAVVTSTLQCSMIRMRNALPRS